MRIASCVEKYSNETVGAASVVEGWKIFKFIISNGEATLVTTTLEI